MEKGQEERGKGRGRGSEKTTQKTKFKKTVSEML